MLKYLVIAASLLFATLPTVQIMANNVPASEQTCILPAPGNLRVTNVGPTYLSFAWNNVAFSAGYDYELRVVSNNQLVDYGHTNNLFYSKNMLAVNVLYEFKVWSVCPNTFERGGVAAKQAQTEYIIVADIAPAYQGNNPTFSPQYNNLFSSGIMEESFKAEYIDGNSKEVILFNLKKLMNNTGGGSSPDNFTIMLMVNNTSSDISNLPEKEWAFSTEMDMVPYAGQGTDSILNSAYCKVHHHPSGGVIDSVLILNPYNNFNNDGTATLKWTQLSDNYKVWWLSTHNFNGPGGGASVNKQLPNHNNPQNISSEISDIALERESAGIAQLNGDEALKVMPNPFSHSLTLLPDARLNQALDIRLMDVNGRVVLTETIDHTSGSKTIPTDHLTSGVYILQYDLDGRIVTHKVLKSN